MASIPTHDRLIVALDLPSLAEARAFVVKAGPAYELLATNHVGEVVMATPAISDGLIIIRGVKHVMAIGQKP